MLAIKKVASLLYNVITYLLANINYVCIW